MKLQNHRQAVLLSASCGLLLLGLLLLAAAGAPVAFATPANLFVTQAGVGTSCSQSAPCTLEMAMTNAVAGDTIYVAGGTYKGVGDAVVTVTKGITLFGGWNGAPSGAIVRNPTLYPSTLNGEQARRVVYIRGNITPTIDGFVITHGNASGLCVADGPTNADGCGGGIYIYNAHAIISHNVITDNVAVLTASGSVTRITGYGGGIFMRGAVRASISSNTIISNAASTVNQGQGGGIHLDAGTIGAMILSNQILGNFATTGDYSAWGGGIWGGPDDSLIQDNIIQGNQTNGIQTGSGAGIYQFGGTAQYIRNAIRGNSGAEAVALNYSRANFRGNQVVDNNTGNGVSLLSQSGNGPILVNNTIARSGSKTLSVQGYDAASVMTATLLHNTLVGSGGGYGILTKDANVYITNTIVVSHSWGITNTTLASSSVLPDHTLFSGNANDGIRGTNPVDGPPAFVNPASADFHLGAGSAAIDAGIATWVTTDIDGEPRPVGLGYDIGADERVAHRSLLPLITK